MSDLPDKGWRPEAPPLQGRGLGWGLSAGRIDQLQERAGNMRRNPTEPEKRLWRHLSNSQLGGHKFRRQAVIGPYITDFLCAQRALVVEVDGDTHDPVADDRRDAWLGARGFRVVRFSNADVIGNVESVLTALGTILAGAPDRWHSPHPNPSPEGEGLAVLDAAALNNRI